MTHRFVTFDVFTDQAFSGNPLAVVLAADDLDDEAMQLIASEFNLSETVFVTEPQGREADYGLRIFTPQSELPFAGHPTVGATIALAFELGGEPGQRRRLIVEEVVGDIICDARINSERNGSARFFLPAMPKRVSDIQNPERIAEAFGLEAGDFLNAPVKDGVWSAGASIGIIPLRYADKLAEIEINREAFEAVFGGENPSEAYVVAKAVSDEHTHDWRARMFAPHLGIDEDPATGSAVAAFYGLLAEQGGFGDGEHSISVYQGIEMGRPSLIRLLIQIENGKLVNAMIGGDAVKVSEGVLI